MSFVSRRPRRPGRTRLIGFAFALGVTLAAGFAAAPALASETPASEGAKAGGLSMQSASERSQRIADVLRSPFCPGKTLLTCTSGQAFTARQEIRDRLVAGEDEESIIDDFKTRYGDNIVNPPQPWYAVISPFIPALVGVLVLGAVTWRWRRARTNEGPAAAPVDAQTAGADADRLARLRRQVSAEDE